MHDFLPTIGFYTVMCAPFIALGCLIAAQLHRETLGPVPAAISGILFLLALLTNPISQYLLLEPFDNRRGSELAQHAHESRLIGSTQSRVRAFLGEPSRIKEYTPDRFTWEYKQLPGYWFGSHFQVFFGATGLVEGFETNDD